jgi:hypothetical protein
MIGFNGASQIMHSLRRHFRIELIYFACNMQLFWVSFRFTPLSLTLIEKERKYRKKNS